MTPRSTNQQGDQQGERMKRSMRRKVASSLTVKELGESWMRALQAKGCAAGTLRLRRIILDSFVRSQYERNEPLRIAEITKPQMERWLIELTDHNYAPSTIECSYNVMAIFFNWCVREEEIEHSPMKRIPKPSVPENPPIFLTEDEQRAMLKTCTGKSFLDRRDKAILLLLIDTGMRCFEMASLRIDAIDWIAGTVSFVGKGRRPRTPHFNTTAADALDAYRRARSRFVGEHPQYATSTALWLGIRGPLKPIGIYETVKRRAAQAGLEGVHPHLFRHGFADAWLEAGGHEGSLAQLAGWVPGSKMLYRYGAARALRRAQDEHKRISPADRLMQPDREKH